MDTASTPRLASRARLALIGMGVAFAWVLLVLALGWAAADARADDGLLGGVTDVVEDTAEPVTDAATSVVQGDSEASRAEPAAAPAAQPAPASQPVQQAGQPVQQAAQPVQQVTQTVVDTAEPVTQPVEQAAQPVVQQVAQPVQQVAETTVAVAEPVVQQLGENVPSGLVSAVAEPVVGVVDDVVGDVVGGGRADVVDRVKPGSPAGRPDGGLGPVVSRPAPEATASVVIDAIPGLAGISSAQTAGAHTSRDAAAVGEAIVDVVTAAVNDADAARFDAGSSPWAPGTGDAPTLPSDAMLTSGGSSAAFAALPARGPADAHSASVLRDLPLDDALPPAPTPSTDVSPD